MTTKDKVEEVKEDWIENKMKEFDELFVEVLREGTEPVFTDAVGQVGPVKQFLRNILTQQKEAIEKEQEDLSRADLYAKGYADGVKEAKKEWVDKIIKLLADSNCTQDPSLIRHYIKELII